MDGFEWWMVPAALMYVSFAFHLLLIASALLGLGLIPLSLLQSRFGVFNGALRIGVTYQLLRVISQPFLPWVHMYQNEYIELNTGFVRPSRQWVIHGMWFLGPPFLWIGVTLFSLVTLFADPVGSTDGIIAILSLLIAPAVAWAFFRSWRSSLSESLSAYGDAMTNDARISFDVSLLSLSPYRLSAALSVLSLVVLAVMAAVFFLFLADFG